MPADFNLLSSTAQVPMKAADIGSGFDPVGATKASYDIAGKKLDVGEKERTLKQQEQDRSALTEAMQSGKYDLSNPEGLEALTKDYGSKLSPDANLHLADLTTKSKQQTALYQQHLTQNSKEQNQLLLDQENSTMPQVGQLLDHYDQVKEAKGEQEARRQYEEGRGHIVAGLQSQKLPNGQPRYSQPVIDWMSNAEPEDARTHYKGSAYRKTLIQDSLNEASMAEKNARAKALGNPQNWTQYVGGDGTTYRYNPRAGVAQVLSNGEWAETPALPPDAKPITGPGSNKGPQSPLGRLLADYDDRKSKGDLTDEQKKQFDASVSKLTGAGGDAVSAMTPEERAWLVEFSQSGGKIPQLPLGIGSSAAVARKQFVSDFVKMGMASGGMPASEAAQEQLKIKATQESLKKLTTQNSIIETAENSVKKAFVNIESELKKIGGPDSPLIRKYWNKSMTEVMGSSEFSALMPYFTEVTEGMSRVYSGVSGAGSPPVGYLELAKKVTDPNQNLGQFLKSRDAMTNLMDNRQKATKDTENRLLEVTTTKMKANPDALRPQKDKGDDTQLDSEVKGYLEVTLPQTTNKNLSPEERKTALEKARSDRAKLIAKGAKLPPLETDIPAPAAEKKKDFSNLWK